MVGDRGPVHAEAVPGLYIPFGGGRWPTVAGSRAHCAVPESVGRGNTGKGENLCVEGGDR